MVSLSLFLSLVSLSVFYPWFLSLFLSLVSLSVSIFGFSLCFYPWFLSLFLSLVFLSVSIFGFSLCFYPWFLSLFLSWFLSLFLSLVSLSVSSRHTFRGSYRGLLRPPQPCPPWRLSSTTPTHISRPSRSLRRRPVEGGAGWGA